MKDFLYFVCIVLVISLIINQPDGLKEFSVSPLGKILFLILILTFAVKYRFLSFLVLILFICLNQTTYDFIEGMDNMDDFRKKNCKGKKLMKNNKPVSVDNISKHFSNLKFDEGKCNPCNKECKFKVTTSNEQLTKSEAVTPKDSKDSFIIKEALKSSKNVEPFSKLLPNMANLDEH